MTFKPVVILFLLGLTTACSNIGVGRLGPHRIDVQQGNALDQESVAKLKPGLSRSQVRFLLGTPLLVDPFRGDRWDYVYTFYKAGKLAEQKRITLFFKDDTLERIEGDVPAGSTGVSGAKETPRAVLPADAGPPESGGAAPAEAPHVERAPGAATDLSADTAPAQSASAPAADAPAPTATDAPGTSVVPPLPSPKGAPPYVDPASASLKSETDVARIRPDAPEFDEASAAPANPSAADDAAILQALKVWSEAWRNRDEETYLAAYTPDFVPQGGGTHADWQLRRRLLLGLARNIDLRIEAPRIEMKTAGHALVTLKQYYRSDNYRDAVVKQFSLVKRGDKWLIDDERVVSMLRPKKP